MPLDDPGPSARYLAILRVARVVLGVMFLAFVAGIGYLLFLLVRG